MSQREGVGTSKIRTSKGQNVKSIFRMIRMLKDQNVKNQNVKNLNFKKNVKSLKINFNVLIFFDAIANIRTLKVEKINYLWRITYVYQGLWGVRLGSIRFG